MITEKKKQTIKLMIAIAILAIILILVLMAMIKYEVEGEQNMPFKLSKIIIVSNAEGIENKTENELKWDFDIFQNNDVSFYIDSNTEDENLLIKSVTIDNIQILKAPQKGKIKVYMPNSEAGSLYNYDDQYLVKDSLQYKGASQSSSTELEIGSKGGTTWICFNNMGIGNYTSNEDKEIRHDGTWLKKLEIAKEEVEFTVSFDYTIETTKTKYKANITLDLPAGNISEDGRSYLEKTDMSDIIFKRVK